jgi:adenylate cyclase
MGLCNPKGPTLTRQSDRAQIGSSPSSQVVDLVEPTNEQRIHRTLSFNESCASICVTEGLAAVCLENSLAEPERHDLVATVKTLSEPEMAHQRVLEWRRTARISHQVRLYSGLGRCRTLEAHSVERKLAAIFAADVEGYSRLMGLDEVGTLRTLTAYRVIIDHLIAIHHGRIFSTAGDSLVADFASAVDALQCAIEVQEAIAKENADRPASEQMRFRIGLHVGDIIVQGDNLFGDGVNIAARLETLAEPGGICISGTVRDQIGTKLPLSFTDLGEQQVKNIAQPIRAYRVRGDTSPRDTPLVGSYLPLPDKPSIAVLPFANMSGDPEQDYFADGMVEEIITALSRIRWLFVIARNSTFTYKGQAVDVKQVGRELGVRYVLEGSVRKAGGRVRITAQLIDAQSGTHLWADRFDGSLEDVFELQDKVASSVAGVIEPTLQAAETARSAGRPTDDLTAYDLYLRAFPMFLSASRQIPEALRLLETAIARDPNYGPALAWAALCCYRLVNDDRSDDAAADARKGIDFARGALEVADDNPGILANAAQALAYFGEDIGAMIALVDRALALNPSFARGWYISGILRLWAGQPDMAIEHLETSLRLSPRARVGPASVGIGAAHVISRRFDEAVPKLILAIQEDPSAPAPYRILAACYAHMGRLNEARAAFERLRMISPDLLPDFRSFLNPDHRNLLLSGLRLAADEAL